MGGLMGEEPGENTVAFVSEDNSEDIQGWVSTR